MSPDASLNKAVESPGARALFVAACFAIVVYALRTASPILVPVALAFFLSMLSFPMVYWLRKKHVPTIIAVLLTVIANVAVISGLVLVMVQSVSQLETAMDGYMAKFHLMKDSALAWLQSQGVNVDQFQTVLNSHGSTITDGSAKSGQPLPPGPDTGQINTPNASPSGLSLSMFDPAAVVGLVQGILSGAASILSKTFLVCLLMIFILAEATTFPDKFRRILGDTPETTRRLTKITREILQYLVIKTLVSAATGILVGVGTWAIGLDFPILWGLVAFVLNYIPTIGSILASIPAVLLAVIQFDGSLAPVAAVLMVYITVNVSLGNFIEPMLVGHRLGLSTLVVLLSLLFWGWVWGPFGMLLAVPMTMVAKIFFENTSDLRWVALLMEKWPPASESPLEPIRQKAKAAVVSTARGTALNPDPQKGGKESESDPQKAQEA